MTKKQEGMLQAYERANSNHTELYHVYGKFSHDKIKAMDYCKKLQFDMNGYGGRIVSANSYQFTYAFKYKDPINDKLCLCYITKAYDYKFAIE